MSKENITGSLSPGAEQRASGTEPPSPGVDPSEEETFLLDWRKCLINAFLVWQLFAVAVWLLPTSILQLQLSSVVRSYMMMTGCWQAWTMFSPQPSNTDLYLDAVVEYKDGSTRTWHFPRTYELNFWDRYREERWRKAIENTEGDTGRGYWPYLARYAALQNDTQPQINPPIKVRLIRHFRIIPQPGVPMPPFTDYEFYQQAITPELVQADTLTLPPPIKPPKEPSAQKSAPPPS